MQPNLHSYMLPWRLLMKSSILNKPCKSPCTVPAFSVSTHPIVWPCTVLSIELHAVYPAFIDRELPLLQKRHQNDGKDDMLLTRQALLHERRESLKQTVGYLELQIDNGDHSNDSETLQKEVDTAKQCLELCEMARESVAKEPPHITQVVGEVVAQDGSYQELVITPTCNSWLAAQDGSYKEASTQRSDVGLAAYDNSSLVVVNILADVFEVNNAVANKNSKILVGSMPEDVLLRMVRYGSQ